MSYVGRYNAGDVIDFKFTSRRFSSGAPYALASGAVKCYKSNSTSPSTAGITLTSTFASLTGVNHVRIETTADSTYYASGTQVDVVIDTGTVDSVSVVGEIVGRFVIGPMTANVTQWSGTNVATPNVAGVPLVDVGRITGSTVSTTSAQIGVNVEQYRGTAVASPNVAGVPLVDVGRITGSTVSTTSAQLGVNVEQYRGTAVASPNVAGVPLVDVGRITGSTVSTTSAQIGANMVQCGGTSVTGRDIGASVLLSTGTGTGQISLLNGKTALSTAAITESYAANGVAMSYDQALYAIHQSLMSFAISSTTISVKKLDGATVAFAVTLDSTTPTQAIRS